MLKRKISIIYLAVAAVTGGIISFAATRFISFTEPDANTVAIQASKEESTYAISRLEGYSYIHPMYLAEPSLESKNFTSLKSDISDFVENTRLSGALDYASVYVKDLNSNDWMEYNPVNRYHPGSLFKVITLITLLRMAESDISILQKEVVYKGLNPPAQTFNSKVIAAGNRYKIKDLIYYMIVYSDNHATMLLHDYVDPAIFEKTFTDLNLPRPDIRSNVYQLSAKEYSRFISVLYDGGYLTIPASEFAISLLCESDFKLGITRELPPNLKIAHKFGEAGVPGNREIHECGIVYLNNRPYLVTIMTKGRDSQQLVEIVSHLSKIVYDHMVAMPS
jgi:beta-lactamase class A